MSDRIEDVLRATGRRPEAPRDVAERVKAALHGQWRTGVRARRRRRRIAVGIALTATIAGVALASRVLHSPSPLEARPVGTVATVEAVSETAWSRQDAARAGSASSLRLGNGLASGAELATGSGGRLALRFASGHSVRLDEETQVRLVSPTTIALDRGTIYVDSKQPSGAASGPIRIETPAGEIRDVGTQFEARWIEDSLRIRVREGAVSLDDGHASIDVVAGMEIVRRADGAVSRRELSPFGDEWTWVEKIAPMLRLEGRSVRDFLDWVARERGLTLRFETAELAASAPGIRLAGSIEKMTLDQALDSVLPTCRMAYRIDHGALIVRSREG